MSGDFWNDRDYAVDILEHQRIRTMCRELKKEKDMLKESLLREQSINAELIRRFESDITAATELHKKEKKYIEELERELRNCTQEIGFLQDQLNISNTESNCTNGHANNLENNSFEVDMLHQKLKILEEKLFQSDSKCLSLMRELDKKESEMENSALQLEKLESSVSSMQLETQCEIESMKLDMTALEQRCFEAERFCEKATQEKGQIDTLFHIHFQETQQIISSLEKENKELQEKLAVTGRSIGTLFFKMEEHLDEYLKEKTGPGSYSSSEIDNSLPINMKEEVALHGLFNYETVLHSYFSKMAIVTSWDENVKDKLQKMSNQIRESECLVSQLKEELRGEKLKAKEEAEDLTQEMAELRYQITEMLEEEHKHRVMIERASLQRIQELEEEVNKEKLKSSKAKHFHEANGLAKARAIEIQHLKDASKVSSVVAQTVQEPSIDVEPFCKNCLISRSSPECFVETSIITCTDGDNQTAPRACFAGYLDKDVTTKQLEPVTLHNGNRDKQL